jgi:hypothetical protein
MNHSGLPPAFGEKACGLGRDILSPSAMAAAAGTIRVGVGGWDYDPWRETFYPPRLARSKQLEYAARRLTAIEINATYYKLQKPESFERWAKTVPEDFRFAIKGSRFCSNRKVLGEAGEAVERFCGQGLAELGDKLGPDPLAVHDHQGLRSGRLRRLPRPAAPKRRRSRR